MSLQDFNEGQLGRDLQAVLDAMSGVDGGAAYLKLRGALQKEDKGPVTQELANSVSFIATFLKVAK